MGQAAKKMGNGGRVNALGGFFPDKVDRKVMQDFVRGHGIALSADKSTSDEQYALALTMHFREDTAPDNLCKCEVCGGEAPDNLEACPFCGIESEPADAEASAEDADDEDDDDAEEEDASAEEEEEDEPVKKAAKKEPKAKAVKAPKAAKSPKAMALAKVAEVLDADTVALARVQEKDLDAAVADVFRLKTDGATTYWELGKKILDINVRGLWKLRKTEDGTGVRWKTFDAFCAHELNMTNTNAYAMMAAAREYTQDDIEKMGHTKAALILKAAPEDRKALAEAAKKGASWRETEKKVRESKKARGYEGTERAIRGAKGAKKRAEKIRKESPAQDKITIAKIEGLHAVKLYAKPASMRGLDLDECKRAEANKAITDYVARVKPFGRLELVNDVVMYLSLVVGKDGNLIVKVDTRRESAVEA